MAQYSYAVGLFLLLALSDAGWCCPVTIWDWFAEIEQPMTLSGDPMQSRGQLVAHAK